MLYVKTILYKYEQEIANSSIENAIVITREGELYHCYGTLNGVWPDIDLGEKLRGADMTHNHPKGSRNEWTFSQADRLLFYQWELNILRGVDELFEYEFNRNSEDVDEPLLITEFDDYSSQHQKIIDDAHSFGMGYRRRRRG